MSDERESDREAAAQLFDELRTVAPFTLPIKAKRRYARARLAAADDDPAELVTKRDLFLQPRVVYTYDQITGEVTGAATNGAVLSGLLKREGIEGATVAEARPRFIVCVDCHAPFEPRARTPSPRCVDCRKEHARAQNRARAARRRAADPDGFREKERRWRAANSERVRAGKRRDYAAHRDSYLERARRHATAKKALRVKCCSDCGVELEAAGEHPRSPRCPPCRAARRLARRRRNARARYHRKR